SERIRKSLRERFLGVAAKRVRLCVSDLMPHAYRYRTHLISSIGLGGLPVMSTPTRKTFEANHTMPTRHTPPHTIESRICQTGGGVSVAMRSTMRNGITGGMKLKIVAIMPFGSCVIGIHSIIGKMRTSITGVSSEFASRMSVTALPTAAMSEAIMP